VKYIWQLGSNDCGSAPDEDHVARPCKTLHGFGDLGYQNPGRWAQTEQVVEDVIHVRSLVLGHFLRQLQRQMVFLQRPFYELAVQNRPWLKAVGIGLLEHPG
jgi:hypothetical protein